MSVHASTEIKKQIYIKVCWVDRTTELSIPPKLLNQITLPMSSSGRSTEVQGKYTLRRGCSEKAIPSQLLTN